MLILVVEDDEPVRRGIKLILQSAGYTVSEAADGKEALSILPGLNPDLILCDIMMPQVDGIALYEEIKKDKQLSLIPFIFLTAKVNDTDIRKGMNLGADDYITKPFNADDLLASVKRRIEKHKYIKDLTDDFLTTIMQYFSHEMRIPLVAIEGFSEIMKDDCSCSKSNYAEFSKAIHRAAKRLHHQVDKYLSYSSIEKQLLPHPEEPVESYSRIKPLISEAKDLAEVNERVNDIKIDVEDSVVLMSEEHLTIVIKELTENACCYSDPATDIIISGRNIENGYLLTFTNSKKIKNNCTGKYNQGKKEFSMGISIVEKLINYYNGKFNFIKNDNSVTVELIFQLPLMNKIMPSLKAVRSSNLAKNSN